MQCPPGTEGRPSPELATGRHPDDHTTPARIHHLTSWRTLMNDLPDPCAEGHTSIIVSFQGGSPDINVCRVCSDLLPNPPWLNCPDCTHLVLDGWIMADFCAAHMRLDIEPEGAAA
jgi:hypothetical protein